MRYVVRHCSLRQKQAKPPAVPRPGSLQKTASRVRSAVGCGGVPGSSNKWHTAHCRHQSVICKVSSLDGSLPRHFLLYPPPACVQPATRMHGIIRMHSCCCFFYIPPPPPPPEAEGLVCGRLDEYIPHTVLTRLAAYKNPPSKIRRTICTLILSN